MIIQQVAFLVQLPTRFTLIQKKARPEMPIDKSVGPLYAKTTSIVRMVIVAVSAGVQFIPSHVVRQVAQ